MTPGDWLITSLGIATALGGLALLAWSLLADRLRTRHARREGTLRRCPRCWYDMSATEGLTCPECGKTARHERRLGRARRRYRHAAASLIILALGAAVIAYPHGRGGVWIRWLPDTAVILLIPYTPDNQLAAEEIGRRLGFRGTAPAVHTPGQLAEWQWSLLRWSAERAWLKLPDPTTGGAVWWLTVMAGPVPDRVFKSLLRMAESDDDDDREWALMCLERSRFWLDDAQLTIATTTIEAVPVGQGGVEERRLGTARMLGAQLNTRTHEPLADRAARWAGTKITPEALTAALDRSSITELVAFYARFHFPRSMLADSAEWLDDAIVVERFDLPIDDDDLDDCVLLAHNQYWESGGSNVHYEALVMLRQPTGWKLLGQIDLSNCLTEPPRFSSVRSSDGHRWLVVERDGGSSTDGHYFVMQDAWYRVHGDRLVVEQAMFPRGHNEGTLNCDFGSSEPRVVRTGTGYEAVYEFSTRLSVSVPVGGGEGGLDAPRLAPLDEQRGVFRFPLGVPESRFGQFIQPGPWDGREPTWSFFGEPEVITGAYRDRLLAIAAAGEPEHAAVLALIDEYLGWAGPLPELVEMREALGAGPPDDPPPP
ncbi:MAG: hypothetical protein IT431_04665 [Phycisphaerales bacterium]|nr:hypothetical protein [Phycisphaerales bacterium]